jgi:hypothetical protein
MNPIKKTFLLLKQSLLILPPKGKIVVSCTVKQSLLNFVIIIVLEKDHRGVSCRKGG